MDRRTFLSRITGLFSVATAGLLSLPVVRFLAGARSEAVAEKWITVARIGPTQLTEEVNQVQYLKVLREGWLTRTVQDTVWIRRKPDGTFLAFGPRCTHLGCAFAWNPSKRTFDCPCHGGKFDINGNRVEGPPPRPLDQFTVRVDGDVLKIGKLKSDS